MADFRLPFSAGAETSSVSSDPRRSVSNAAAAPIQDDEITQVTQTGGQPALNVGNAISAQFGAGGSAATADQFSADAGAPTFDPNARNASAEDVVGTEKGYINKRGVWAEITRKKGDQVRIKNRAFDEKVRKAKTNALLDKREKAKSVADGVQAKRRVQGQQVRNGELAHETTKTVVGKEVKVQAVRTDNVQSTGVQAQNVQDTGKLNDPSRK
jgi:hypothetical protein